MLTLSLFVAAVSFYIMARPYNFDGDYFLRCIEDAVYSFTGLLVYPLYFLYFRFLVDNRKLRWWEYLIFIPALLVGGGSLIGYFIMGKETAIGYARDILYSYNAGDKPADFIYSYQFLINVRLFNWFVFLQAIVTVIYALLNLKLWQQKLDGFYSNLDEKYMRGNYIVLLAIIVCFIVTMITTLFVRTFYTSSFFWIAGIFLAFAAGIYVLAYSGYHLKCTTEDLTQLLDRVDEETAQIQMNEGQGVQVETPNDDGCNKNKLPRGLSADFQRLMVKDKIYLQRDLRLDDLIRRMHTNRTYISRLINEEYHCSFSDLINNYRIEYAKRLMLYSEHLSLEGIALQSGFLHLSSFSRTFKRVTGVTPGAWQKVQKEFNEKSLNNNNV